MLKAKDIMTKDIISVTPDTEVVKAAKILKNMAIGSTANIGTALAASVVTAWTMLLPDQALRVARIAAIAGSSDPRAKMSAKPS